MRSSTTVSVKGAIAPDVKRFVVMERREKEGTRKKRETRDPERIKHG